MFMLVLEPVISSCAWCNAELQLQLVQVFQRSSKQEAMYCEDRLQARISSKADITRGCFGIGPHAWLTIIWQGKSIMQPAPKQL